MKVSYGKYHDSRVVQTVDESVWVSCEQATTQTGLDFRAGKWKGSRSPYRTVELDEEIMTQTASLVVPGNSVIQLGLGQRQKDGLQIRRHFSMTSS